MGLRHWGIDKVSRVGSSPRMLCDVLVGWGGGVVCVEPGNQRSMNRSGRGHQRLALQEGWEVFPLPSLPLPCDDNLGSPGCPGTCSECAFVQGERGPWARSPLSHQQRPGLQRASQGPYGGRECRYPPSPGQNAGCCSLPDSCVSSPFPSFPRGSSKIEEACEIYTRAANMFKMAKNWSGM